MVRSFKNAWEDGRNHFDFLRLALAVLVIFSHSYPLGTGTEVREPFHVVTHGQMTGGAIAVDLFFIMSGFLITASAERSSSKWSFLKKRVRRIYPAFLTSAVLTVAIVVPLSHASIFGHVVWSKCADVVFQTLRLREFDSIGAFSTNPYPGAINGSVWSIQYEFWCYIGVLLLLTYGFLRRRGVLLGVLFAAVAMSVLFQVKGWLLGASIVGRILGSPTVWARLLPLYLAGIVFYLFRERIPVSGWLAIASLFLLLGSCWLRFGLVAAFPFAGTYLVFYLAFARWLRLEHFGRFGDFSYGTYLYAFPLMQVTMQSIGHPVAPLRLFMYALPMTLLVAVASWYGVERTLLLPVRRKETIVAAVEHETERTNERTNSGC